jgi:ABC-type multidrug transport system fused ATPase/permease subunit
LESAVLHFLAVGSFCCDFVLLGRCLISFDFPGQKQRVALARAAYAVLRREQEDRLTGKTSNGIVILDDPLSALDAGTSKLVFERLLKGQNALFSNVAVVLVTHASHFLNRVDNIVVLVDGKNEFTGTWIDLLKFQSNDEKVAQFFEFIRSSVQEEENMSAKDKRDVFTDSKRSRSEEAVADNLMKVEEREYGLASTSTWLLWFKHAGGFFFMSFQILFMSIDRFAYVAVEYWLVRWTNAAEKSIMAFGTEFAPQTDGREAQYQFLKVFSALILASILGTILRCLWSVTGGVRAAKNVFTAMLVRVLGAPMSYFESTPQGRLLNRFTYDTVRFRAYILDCFIVRYNPLPLTTFFPGGN